MSKDTETLKHDAEVAQFRFALIAPVIQASFSIVENLSQTERGSGGFGSTSPLPACRSAALNTL